MKENPNEYMPFLEGIDGEMMNENEYKIYCQKIENSSGN